MAPPRSFSTDNRRVHMETNVVVRKVPNPSIPTFHLLSQDSPSRSRSKSRSRSPDISENKNTSVLPFESPSYTSETDPTWRYRKKYNCLVVEDTEEGFSSEEGEGEEITSVYDPTKLTCVEYFFMDDPPKRPSWLEPCGDVLCPVCTVAGAERYARLAAEGRPAPGSGLFRARRPLKRSSVMAASGDVGKETPSKAACSDADNGGTSFKSNGNKGKSIKGKGLQRKKSDGESQ
ncbi:unnamed protein product [Cuscuta campestris]|uniref:Uncharacterized protein n=1 Tax=Cuscuta campestris TaxID=132261 RepID=A0A484KNQ5_9ASTE|nr:unnamed protein product [Cuscuta campestris]